MALARREFTHLPVIRRALRVAFVDHWNKPAEELTRKAVRQVLEALRKTREELWDKKFASRT